MGFVGSEETFLKVQDLDRAIDFYHNQLGIPLDRHDHERAYLQCDRGHLVLHIENSTARHQAGGPLHFAFTVTEETSTRASRSPLKAERSSSSIQMGMRQK